MRYTTKLFSTKTAHVIIPEFFPTEGTLSEEENARRMNDFYGELKSSVFGYTESPAFPEDGRYYAKAQIMESAGNGFDIRVSLRLRSQGKTKSAKTLKHKWENGVVTQKEIEE